MNFKPTFEEPQGTQMQLNENGANSSSFSFADSVVFYTEHEEDYIPNSTSKSDQEKATFRQDKQDTADSSECLKKPQKNKPSGPVQCGCGLRYGAYPALYTHIKRKHNGIPPKGTKYGSENKNQKKKGKSGRPPVFRENEGAPSKKIKEETMIFTAQNDMYVALGQMGISEFDSERMGRSKKVINLVYDETLQVKENHPTDKYYHPFHTTSLIRDAIQERRLILPTIEELLDDDNLDCEDELKVLLDKTDRSFIQFLAATLAWLCEKFRMQFFKEYCLIMDVLVDSCMNFETFHLHGANDWTDLLKIMNGRLATCDTANIKNDLYSSPVLFTLQMNRLVLKSQNVAKVLRGLENIAKTYHL